MSSLLSLAGIHWQVDNKPILDNISLDVDKGEVIGIIGPNGAGKTSLLRCILQQQKQTSGCIYFKSKNISQYSSKELAKYFAMVAQKAAPIFALTLYDVVRMGLLPHKTAFSLDNDHDRHQIRLALEKVGLSGDIDTAFNLLSGGEQQRALIARALVQQAEILILDEPTSGLDPGLEGKMMARFQQVARAGCAVLVSTHAMQSLDRCDLLVVLDDIRARSDVNLLNGRLGAALAIRARLAAERDRAEGIAFPDELDRLIGNEDERIELIEGELTIFEERRNFLRSQTSINRQRIEQLKSEILGLRDEVVALNRQLELIAQEEEGLSGLVEKGLARKPQLLELQRRQADLGGELARNKAAIARAQQQIGETELTIIDIRTRFLNEVVGQLQEVQTEIADLRDRMAAADDVIRRTEVTAPVSGVVVNVQVNTAGGVIGPGQPLMDIVPKAGGLTVEARVSPGDIDVVHSGLSAQVRISAFKIAENPILEGRVRTVSADALSDERTGETFYLAQIDLQDLSPLPPGAELQPGMQAEVMIVTGEQTPLQYLLEPIRISLRRAMRES